MKVRSWREGRRQQEFSLPPKLVQFSLEEASTDSARFFPLNKHAA